MSAFDKVIGYDDIKAELMRFCDVLKNPEKYEALGVKRPGGILLHGEPGIGKTIMAEAFVEESGCPFFVIRKSKPDGDFVNYIKETFDRAKEKAPSIVFLDDMDKYANEDERHRDADEYITVQACIDDMKGKDVFVIATANDKFCLPDSLMRAGRFSKVIEMKNPKGEDAVKIIEYYLGQKKLIGDINARDIAKMVKGHTCAELESVINEAGIYAGFEDRKCIEQKDLVKACMRLIFDSPESNRFICPEAERNVAVHEAGHALVGEFFDSGSVCLVSVHGNADSYEGITVCDKEDVMWTREQREQFIIRKLAGKAATEIVYGVADIGCKIDVVMAFEYVGEMVDDLCCMSFDSYGYGDTSDHLLENKDRRVALEMERLYGKAKEIIAKNREKLDALTDELMEKKILTGEDVRRIMAA